MTMNQNLIVIINPLIIFMINVTLKCPPLLEGVKSFSGGALLTHSRVVSGDIAMEMAAAGKLMHRCC